MIIDLLGKLRRAAGKRPSYLARRLWLELLASAERWRGPARCRRLSVSRLTALAGHRDADAWWDAVASKPFPGKEFDAAAFDAIAPGAREEVLRRAADALEHRVDLLGSGPVVLGERIDWHTDFKTGIGWSPRFHRDIAYAQLDLPCDVKVPWELSRLQWALPLAQAWRLTGDDRYAGALRKLLQQWIEANPYGASVNWACTMEPALRILCWSWLFHACHAAPSWRDVAFRGAFLRMLWLHADFVARNLEESDVNGNHYTADAAGLVYAGLFFGGNETAQRWLDAGWAILRKELPRQVASDGVDFEASVPYHRLVSELFVYPAIYRRQCGLEVPSDYLERVAAMGRFVAAYSRRDGSSPWWGDADDGRALALGTQALQDHRYLLGVLVCAFEIDEAREDFSGPRDEVAWLLGTAAAGELPVREQAPARGSRSFPKGGFHVLRYGDHHVFVDVGPLGLAGRGGHGHNDLLSFEAVLGGIKLVTDCGAYLYTASAAERNRFRSTAFHNTPQVDGEEINRFVRPDFLWTLHNDARHRLIRFEADAECSVLEGSHDGYSRLGTPVVVYRSLRLEHVTGRLEIHDRFEGTGQHRIDSPLHLAPGVEAIPGPGRSWHLLASGRRFVLNWEGHDWDLRADVGRASPSYGVVDRIVILRFSRDGELASLRVWLEPQP